MGWLLIFSDPRYEHNPDRTRSNVRSVSHQPQVLAALGELLSMGLAGQGKRPSVVSSLAEQGLGMFFATKHAAWEDRRGASERQIGLRFIVL